MTTRGDDLTKVSVIKSLRTHTIRKVIVLQELQLEAGFDRQENLLTALDKVSSNKSLAGPSRPSTFTGDTPATPKAWVRVRTWGVFFRLNYRSSADVQPRFDRSGQAAE